MLILVSYKERKKTFFTYESYEESSIIFLEVKQNCMISGEYVMAVLCAPLTAKDLLQAEKSNNVFIMRRLEYDNHTSYFSERTNMPYKLMFVFSRQEAIVVRCAQDRNEVERRLGYLQLTP